MITSCVLIVTLLGVFSVIGLSIGLMAIPYKKPTASKVKIDPVI